MLLTKDMLHAGALRTWLREQTPSEDRTDDTARPALLVACQMLDTIKPVWNYLDGLPLDHYWQGQ
ncbi:hypothetical protein SAMN04488118_1073 [Epibacterium ulvae]|uniref:Uncharacterized protein n=1 Tax=Epibacterium ulvae TaxID=1156985 RepID=A0A1G5R049_9RHOB|nr:hypothetical protein SAMN04488118_1073 [Epibacterium ulvae]